MIRKLELLVLSLGLMCLAATPAMAQSSGLQPVGSQADLEAAIQANQDLQESLRPPPKPPCDPQTDPDCEARQVDEIVVTGSRIASGPTITNNQEVGVDEGDIVKARGDTLVILRRGRLFSVSTAGGGLRAVDRINAYAAEVEAGDDWYDEMLVSGDWVVVIGFSYRRGGTEINRFKMDAAGRFTFVDSYHLKSDDYYSSRNYASRLIGEELVFYTPVYATERDGPLQGMPMLSHWQGDKPAVVTTIVQADDIYRAAGLDQPGVFVDTLHTVVRCDLTAPEMTCKGVAILGPRSRNFYVAPTAVYVWVASRRPYWTREQLLEDEEPPAWLYRIPLDGTKPLAAATRGVPIDQFSFQENPEARNIAVMVVSEGRGDGMWGAERARGHAALLTLPFERFGDGDASVTDDDYRILPGLPESYGARNRFVGDHLLYSGTINNHWRDDGKEEDQAAPEVEGLLTIVPLKGGPVVRYVLPGEVGRIEVMGEDAMVVTTDEDMVFTTVSLAGPRPIISDQFVVPDSHEAESRSHAFYFLPDVDSPDGSRGVLGLPIFRELDEEDEGRFSYSDRNYIGAVAFMRRGGGRVSPLGTLDATPGVSRIDDGCEASCYGWYGDARPIFLNGRIFALLGYEIIEGRERAGRMREVRRISMTPPTPEGPRPYYFDY